MSITDISVQELEFFATQATKVTILPTFNQSEIYLLSSSYGPFKANQQVDVPLWLAINLKEKQKCNILPPKWLNPQTLTQMLQAQKKEERLCSMPHQQFFETSYVFLRKAPDNVGMTNKVKILVNDIEEVRNRKINKTFENTKGAMRLHNVTMFEMNKRREPLIKMVDTYQRILKSNKEES